jgi:hypothetical protein
LVNSQSGRKPRQADLRRALSTAYYALFHCLAQSGADLLVGGAGAQKSREAWRQVYRALGHGDAKKACSHTKTKGKFPQPIQDFANTFRTMQEKRHIADYDPIGKFFESAVTLDIDGAEDAIKNFSKASKADRRAFAAWVLFKSYR